MSSPRNPEIEAEKALNEQRRISPTQREEDRAVERGTDHEPDDDEQRHQYRD